MSAGMFLSIIANLIDYISPCISLWVVHPDQFNLPQVKCFAAHIHIGTRKKIKPKLCFPFTNIRHTASLMPVINEFSLLILHGFIGEIPGYYRKTKGLEYPFRNTDLIDLFRDDLEQAALEDDIRIISMKIVNNGSGSIPEGRFI